MASRNTLAAATPIPSMMSAADPFTIHVDRPLISIAASTTFTSLPSSVPKKLPANTRSGFMSRLHTTDETSGVGAAKSDATSQLLTYGKRIVAVSARSNKMPTWQTCNSRKSCDIRYRQPFAGAGALWGWQHGRSSVRIAQGGAMSRIFHGWPLVTALVLLVIVWGTVGLFVPIVAALCLLAVVVLIVGAVIRKVA